jgi:hypothetical protein
MRVRRGIDDFIELKKKAQRGKAGKHAESREGGNTA